MAVQLSIGKWRRLKSLTDEQGRFKMLAIDQRGSLRRALARCTQRDPREITHKELAQVKAIITRTLAPYATAVLTDPEFGYPASIAHWPPRCGLLLAQEESSYTKADPKGKGRTSHLLDGWSVEKAQRAGADAAKLLIYYHPDAPEDVRLHQQELVQRVGEECERTDMPFLLEIVSYPLDEKGTDAPEFARAKPDLVIRSAEEFSKLLYRVDILKLEFPADLKWMQEFSMGAFDGRERAAVYVIQEVREFCAQLNEASGVPWVILSAGVDIQEFLVQVDLATEAGASGFLCGRAIWKDSIGFYPDTAKMEASLRTQGAYNFIRANAHTERALPWFCHRKFGGHIELAQQDHRWFTEYESPDRVN